ncbi:histidine kinase [Parasphingorhabdus sp. JC815]|uniref:histidine kinase n=1 Tax=Parasphingorhabdus sp. JC815 TaxID=3232140 RepID=UPI0034578045
MQHKQVNQSGIAIQTLLLRYFLPAIAIVAIALAILVYDRIYGTILEGFDAKLETTSALTGALIDPADHDWLIHAARKKQAEGVSSENDSAHAEQSPQYIRNALPMRNIREELDLTYLYTQLIIGEGDILYILDASEGDDHSPLGSSDQLPAETMDGLRKVAKDGSVYISPIEYQEQWGLLKTAAAPVGSMDSDIAASAGADVNISVIQIATQNILFVSALIGLASLIICGLVTLILVRRIALPIAQLKNDALKIAAGKLAPPEQPGSPREAAILGDSLTKITRKITGMRDKIQTEIKHSKREHDRAFIDNILPVEPQDRAVRLVDNERTLALWVARTSPLPGMNLKIYAMKMLSQRIAEDSELASNWKNLVDTAQDIVIILDRTTGTANVTGETAITLYKDKERTKPVLLSPGNSIDLDGTGRITVLVDQCEISLNLQRNAAL